MIKKKFVYLAEIINGDSEWEWYNVYDPEKWTELEIFQSIIKDGYDENAVLKTNSIKKENSYHIHKDYDIRVWKVYI